MTSTAPVLRRGLPDVSYYAPGFRVEVEGVPLAPVTNGDVLSLSVKSDLERMGSFELSIANPFDVRRGFKYSDPNIFDIGRQVHVQMGYQGRFSSMITGQITTLSAQFPSSGTPTIMVSGQDGMFRLRDNRPEAGTTIQYINMTDYEIAREIAARNSLQVEVTEDGPRHVEVIQRMTDDATFLKERAARIDFQCYIRSAAEGGESTLCFVRPTDGRDSTALDSYSFRWGESLISFRPTINLTDQVGSVTVRGWDPITKQTIIGRAGPEDLPRTPGGGESGPAVAARTQQGKQDVIVDAPVTSQDDAFFLARSLLTQRAYRFVTASAQVIGKPELRAGLNVNITGVGSRFSGAYHVTSVDHNISNDGYTTSFEVRSMYQGGQS
jgi:phage protein D